MRVCLLGFVTREEVANNDDVSDVDLERRWRSTHHSADRGDRQAAEKMIICAAKIGQ